MQDVECLCGWASNSNGKWSLFFPQRFESMWISYFIFLIQFISYNFKNKMNQYFLVWKQKQHFVLGKFLTVVNSYLYLSSAIFKSYFVSDDGHLVILDSKKNVTRFLLTLGWVEMVHKWYLEVRKVCQRDTQAAFQRWILLSLFALLVLRLTLR